MDEPAAESLDVLHALDDASARAHTFTHTGFRLAPILQESATTTPIGFQNLITQLHLAYFLTKMPAESPSQRHKGQTYLLVVISRKCFDSTVTSQKPVGAAKTTWFAWIYSAL